MSKGASWGGGKEELLIKAHAINAKDGPERLSGGRVIEELLSYQRVEGGT